MKNRDAPDIKPTLVDSLVKYFNPVAAMRRQKARQVLAYTGGYQGGKRDRRSMRTWRPHGNSADADILPDLADLRNRTRDLARNTPVATGAINTVVTSVVGDGLQLKPEINAKFLSMTEDQADAWEQSTAREWKIFCKSADFTSVQNFQDLQALMFRATLESGDVFAIRRFREDFGDTYGTKIQFIEADRVSNPNRGSDGMGTKKNKIFAGVEINRDGRHQAYHVSDEHPGALHKGADDWRRVPARDKQGRPIVIHMFDRLRPDQTRGVPYLAPVIEALKQMGDYSDAEIMGAVVSAMFTVFVKSETGDDILDTDATSTSGVLDANEELSLGNGAIVDLAAGEDITFANPSRPNSNFEPFMAAFLRQVGSALELPFELLIKHFTASYSASRAALEMAWQFFARRRGWMIRNFLQPIYEWFLEEAIALGRVTAPGFFNDPAIRLAYSNADWIGATRIGLDPLKEARADKTDIELGTKTRAQVVMERTGGTWESKHAQSVKEITRRRDAGIEEPPENNQTTTSNIGN